MLRTFNIFESKFEVNSEGYSIKKYSGDEAVLFIPDKYYNKSITSISGGAFRLSKGVRIVILSDQIISMHSEALLGCEDIILYTPHKRETDYFTNVQNVTIRYGYEDVHMMDGVYYSLFNDEVKEAYIFGYNQNEIETYLEIDPIIGGYEVKGFEQFALAFNETLEGITLSNGISTIPKGCFYNNVNLETIVLSESIKRIEDYSFYSCSGLKSIVLSKSINYVSPTAFKDTQHLVVLSHPDNIDCTNGWDNDIHLFNGYIDTVLDEDIIYAIFKDNKAMVLYNQINSFTDLNIKNSITHKGVTYTITAIGPKSFEGSNFIQNVIVPSNIEEVFDFVFSKSNIASLKFNGSANLHNDVCSDCLFLKEVSFAEGQLEVSENGFFNNISLSKVNVPRSLKTIKKAAFYDCYSLKHFDFFDSLEFIGDLAFYGTDLHYVEIGKNVRYVGELGFGLIASLRTVLVMSEKALYGDKFITDENKVSIYIKGEIIDDHVLSILGLISKHHNIIVDNYVLYEKEGLKYLLHELKDATVVGYIEKELPKDVLILDHIAGNAVTKYETSLFRNSKNIETCIFPDTIINIEGNTFENANKLKKVTFKNNIDFEEAKFIIRNEHVEINIENGDMQL